MVTKYLTIMNVAKEDTAILTELLASVGGKEFTWHGDSDGFPAPLTASFLFEEMNYLGKQSNVEGIVREWGCFWSDRYHDPIEEN